MKSIDKHKDKHDKLSENLISLEWKLVQQKARVSKTVSEIEIIKSKIAGEKSMIDFMTPKN